ncbi:hypothetical protein HFD88_005912 [Aspergillus terreus]|nr:hypothetical protein HFD88_005912 [Aspergillus terreus]
MAPLLAPYNSSMRLGSVTKADNSSPVAAPNPEDGVAQSVVWKSSMIDKTSDVTDALNVSGALTIKYNDLIDGTGKGTFINSNKMKDADINFLISVKVVNQTVTDNSLTKFQPLANVTVADSVSFTKIYGDTFISGFQEGGEFHAIVSIKVRDQTQKESIKAEAAVALTTPTFGSNGDKKSEAQPKQAGESPPPPPDDDAAEMAPDPETAEDGNSGSRRPDQPNTNGSRGLTIKGNAEVEKERQAIFKENETTISVVWAGGGQRLKDPEEDWNIEILRKAALRFPSLVAETPVYTHAILTRYEALRSYHEQGKDLKPISPLSYENVSLYTSILQDAFMDYKNIYKQIRNLEQDFGAGVRRLKKTELPGKLGVAPDESTGDTSKGSLESDAVTQPYEPTLTALEKAKGFVRYSLHQIVLEVDTITANPDVAGKRAADLPCQCPLIFKQYLPIGVPVSIAESA